MVCTLFSTFDGSGCFSLQGKGRPNCPDYWPVPS